MGKDNSFPVPQVFIVGLTQKPKHTLLTPWMCLCDAEAAAFGDRIVDRVIVIPIFIITGWLPTIILVR